MADEVKAESELTGTIARARGLAGPFPIGTGHLLYSAAHDRETAALLDPFEITPIVVRTVLKTPGRAGAEPDTSHAFDPDGDAPAEGTFAGQPVVRDEFDHVAPLSAAAFAALSATTSRVSLLSALLADAGSEASAVVRDAGVDPAEVLAAARAGTVPERPDRLDPQLRPARDALLCRTRYQGRGFQDRLLFKVLAREINHAERPVMWIRLEADRIAKAERRATRTDDVLLAMLVTYEVATAFPHLSGAFRGLYGGGETLTSRNITHSRVREAARDLAGQDDVPPNKIIVPGPDWSDDTRRLLDRLAAHPGNRSSRLLAALD